MYEKIANAMGDEFNIENIEVSDVENYMRYGDKTYLDEDEIEILEMLAERYI